MPRRAVSRMPGIAEPGHAEKPAGDTAVAVAETAAGQAAALLTGSGNADDEKGENLMAQALIIEGNMLIGCELSKRLAEMGFDSLDHVWTEEDAIAMAAMHPPDLIVVGDHVQSGDGVMAARRICGTRDVPVLLVTRDAARKSRRLGRGAVLDGPFSFNKLAEAVDTARRLPQGV
ncbi:hypothetical protein [Altererythrobacter aquiaggeris]|uniref:hypothetical protein n=1 Tax=Aestuarierythrobacter aquiaggeris TaxID=1898396 RepID=UPI00301A99B6